MLKFNNFLMVGAWNVTKFYAMFTFCINSIDNELFKIVFLLKTTFIFSWHSLSHEVCMIYPDSYWLSAYLLPFVGMSTLLWLGAWNFLSMAIKIRNFKCYLRCVRVENLFTIHIFEICAKICICPCNFRAQLLLTKIQLINAKSQMQPRWRPSSPEILEKSKLSTIVSGPFLYIFKNYLCRDVPCYLVHLTAYSVFSFLQLYFWR